jgi:AraC family transcriptional regulator
MKVEVVERHPARVAYLRYTGPFGEPLARFWRKSVTPWLAEHDLVDCPRYGVPLDNPMRTPPDQCRYNACVEMPPGLSLPDAEEATIAGGRYAVTRFKGSGANIGAAWGAFVGECLAGGVQPDESRPPLEFYPRGAVFDARTGVFACELCLPVSG